MIRASALLAGVSLLAMVAGCHHVAGVCDCVQPTDHCMPYGMAPHASAAAMPLAPQAELVPAMPKAAPASTPMPDK